MNTQHVTLADVKVVEALPDDPAHTDPPVIDGRPWDLAAPDGEAGG